MCPARDAKRIDSQSRRRNTAFTRRLMTLAPSVRRGKSVPRGRRRFGGWRTRFARAPWRLEPDHRKPSQPGLLRGEPFRRGRRIYPADASDRVRRRLRALGVPPGGRIEGVGLDRYTLRGPARRTDNHHVHHRVRRVRQRSIGVGVAGSGRQRIERRELIVFRTLLCQLFSSYLGS